MKSIVMWARQPSTLLALALLAAAGAYWFTRNAAVAAGVAAAILGGVDDQTQNLLVRLEAIEDAFHTAKSSTSTTDPLQTAIPTAAVKPLACITIAVLFSSAILA